MMDLKTYDLQLGNCLELMKNIPDESIDFICCDPPYGTTSIKWDEILDFKKMWEQYGRIIKPKGMIALFGSQPFSSQLICSKLEWFKYELIWNKNCRLRCTYLTDATRLRSERFSHTGATSKRCQHRLGGPECRTLWFGRWSHATTETNGAHQLQPPTRPNRLPDQHQHGSRPAMKKVDLVAEATAIRIRRKT